MKHFSPFQCDQKRILRPTRMNHGGKGRTFLHVDLDAFFASVEQIKNPKLKGKPVVVGGRSSKRGVVTAASYEAKRRGIKTGMPWQQARACCPEAIFLPADFDAYAIYSRLVRKILEKMSPVVAPASIDECYLDLTGCEKIYGSLWNAADKIRQEILERTGLSSSIGMGASHSVAKIASKFAKPAGILEVPAGSEGAFLAPLLVEQMPGIGPRLGDRLRNLGVATLGQLARLPAGILKRQFGVYGPFLLAKARGVDDWELEISEEVKSIGKERTFENDISDPKELRKELWELVEMVGRELRQKKLCTRSVRVKVRYADFSEESKSITLKETTNLDRVLFQCAEELLLQLLEKNSVIFPFALSKVEGHLSVGASTSHCVASSERTERPLRLLGFCAAELGAPSPQADLFHSQKSNRWDRLHTSIDWLREKFGVGAILIRH